MNQSQSVPVDTGSRLSMTQHLSGLGGLALWSLRAHLLLLLLPVTFLALSNTLTADLVDP
jgi:hypothetical protein